MKARRSLYKQKLMKLVVYQQVELCVCAVHHYYSKYAAVF
jgi:hypothetical protein